MTADERAALLQAEVSSSENLANKGYGTDGNATHRSRSEGGSNSTSAAEEVDSEQQVGEEAKKSGLGVVRSIDSSAVKHLL